MNRQTKRMLQRQGQLGPDGQPAAPRGPSGPGGRPPGGGGRPPAGPGGGGRGGRGQFIKDVRGELRKVAWPTRAEVVNYSTIVLLTLIILIGLIFVLDLAFGKAVFFLFDT